MPERAIRTVLEGMSYLEGPRWHDGRLYVSDFYTGAIVARRPRRRRRPGDRRHGARAALGPGLDAGRLAARRLDARPPAAALPRRRRARGPRRPVGPRAVAPQRHGRRLRRAAPSSATSASTSWRAARSARRPSSASTPTARRPSRPRTCCSRTGPSSRPTPGRDRGRDARRPADGVRPRRRRHAVEPARVGELSPVSTPRTWASCWRRAASRRTARRSTPRAASGPPTRSAGACCACARAARSPRRSRRAPASSPARSAGPRGGRSSCAPPPSFAEHERRDTREAVLLACEVDVPRRRAALGLTAPSAARRSRRASSRPRSSR